MRKFRLGTTSYVIPDEIMPNIRFLAGKTDDIALILFEVEEDNQSNLPTVDEMEELRMLAAMHEMTFTVHLPLDLRLAAGGAETERSLRKALRVMDHVRCLDPFAWILHVEGSEGLAIEDWTANTERALISIGQVHPLDKVCVENLEGFPEDFLDPLLERVPVGRCIDIGHLWVDGLQAVPYLERRLDRTRVIHLHGIGTRDHQSLRNMSREQVEGVLETLLRHEYDGVVTLEMFSEQDVTGSQEMIREIMEQHGWEN